MSIKQNFSKVKLLKLWEILKRDSDEDRPLTTNEILAKLKAEGIICDRRTLYEDIKVLIEHGYDVQVYRGTSNQYCVVDRSFDMPELRILMDAVQAATFITDKKTKEMIEKIADLGGSHKADILKKNIVQFNNAKNHNESIYYNVDAICTAITEGKKVSFLYFDYDINKNRVYRKDGKRYIVNPVATVYSQDNYYLVCYDDKHKQPINYRIDRMDRVEIEEADKSNEECIANFDVSKHRQETFSMFRGETATAKFWADATLVDAMLDKFGAVLKMQSSGDNGFEFTAKVQLSPVFYGWCCSFGAKLKLLGNERVVSGFIEYMESVKQIYQDN